MGFFVSWAIGRPRKPKQWATRATVLAIDRDQHYGIGPGDVLGVLIAGWNEWPKSS